MKTLFSKSALTCSILPLSGLTTLTGHRTRTLTAFEEPVSGKSGKYNQFTSKNIIKFSIILLMFCSTSVAFGQTTPPPSVKIEDGGKDYYRHGYNSTGGGNTLQNPGREERDSLTVEAVMKYFVLPNPKVSPNYRYDTPTNLTDFSEVNSTFAWSLKTSPLGNITTGDGTPLITVTWGATPGDDELSVVETPNAGSGACGDGEPTTIPVVLIPKPTIEFVPKNSLYSDTDCKDETTVQAGIEVEFVMNFTTSSSQIQVDYTIHKDGEVSPSVTETGIPIVDGKLTIEFDDYGSYEITITKVTDRISRKSSVDGEIATGVSQANKFTFVMQRPIQTGPIYRLPNNY